MTSSAPAYHGYEFLHPLKELSRGRFGSGLLLVYDAKKCLHVSAKRVSKRNEESFERQVALHMRASSHFNVVRFLGLLPSSTSCFQYAIEYVPDGDLRQLVVSDIGLPDEPSKYIFRQVRKLALKGFQINDRLLYLEMYKRIARLYKVLISF